MPIIGLGIAYMGSKRKLAPKILTHIIRENPKAKYFYDLFGGGGSISFMALQVKQFSKVHYNEYDPSIVNLLKHIKENGVNDDMYNWVSREDYFKNKDDTNWKSGLLKTIWSFGNNGKGFLYGKDLEKNQKMMYHIVVKNNIDDIFKFKEMFDFSFDCDELHNSFKNKDMEQRKTIISRIIKNKSTIKGEKELEKLIELERLRRLDILGSFKKIKDLSQFKQLKNLSISNLSYEDVIIDTPEDETILYLDPPYHGTASYNSSLDFNKLKTFIKESKFKIYVSEYKNTYDLKIEKEFKHRSILSSSSNNEVVEKLYCNK